MRESPTHIQLGPLGQALLLYNVYMLRAVHTIFFSEQKKTRREDPTGERTPYARGRRFTGVRLLEFALCQKQHSAVWHLREVTQA
jgi:hypothetical protein